MDRQHPFCCMVLVHDCRTCKIPLDRFLGMIKKVYHQSSVSTLAQLTGASTQQQNAAQLIEPLAGNKVQLPNGTIWSPGNISVRYDKEQAVKVLKAGTGVTHRKPILPKQSSAQHSKEWCNKQWKCAEAPPTPKRQKYRECHVVRHTKSTWLM